MHAKVRGGLTWWNFWPQGLRQTAWWYSSRVTSPMRVTVTDEWRKWCAVVWAPLTISTFHALIASLLLDLSWLGLSPLLRFTEPHLPVSLQIRCICFISCAPCCIILFDQVADNQGQTIAIVGGVVFVVLYITRGINNTLQTTKEKCVSRSESTCSATNISLFIKG